MREITDRITKVMDIIAGVVLVFMMFLTVTDVTLRYLGRPFQGAYEIVALGAAIVIAFAMPRTSIAYQNVAVEVVVNLVAPRVRRWFSVFTRYPAVYCLGLWAHFQRIRAMSGRRAYA